jgi:beta-lysine 5,6-aminomutase alpha subunit
VLGESVDLLRRICDDGLLNAIADGTFGITKRPADGGRGLEGVITKADGYFNPASDILDDSGRSPDAGVLAAASQNGAAK